jgi:hypothetical protein
MADNILSAKVDVTAPGAVQALSSVGKSVEILQSQLQRLQKILSQEGLSFTQVQRVSDLLRKTQGDLNKLNAANATTSLGKLGVASNQSTLALTNLGRVVQDAPFGFLGIANNLNPLLESFQRLKATTGTTGGALNELGKSLTGAGGLGFALSLVSSALIVFGDKLFGSKAASEASEQALRKYTDALDESKRSVESLSSSLQFFNQLGSINVKIFNQGDLEDLRQQSVAQRQATEDLKSELEKRKAIVKSIESDEVLNKKDRIDALRSANAEVFEINKQITDSERKQSIIYRQIQLQKNKDEKDAQDKSLENWNKYLKSLQDDRDFLDGLFKNEFNSIKSFYDSLNAKIRIQNDQKARIKISADIELETLSTNFDKQKQISSQLQERINTLIKNNPILIRANAKVELTPDEKALQAALDNINNILADTLRQSLVSFGEGLGEALAGGDIQKAFQSFAGLVGGAVKAIGEQLIALGTAALAAKVALKSLFKNPALQIAAGIALVAVGSAMQSLLSGGIKGFAGGGQLPGAGVPVLVGERGPEIFIPDTGGRIIPNHKIATGGVNGGSGSINVVVNGYLTGRGNDLIAVISSAQRSNNRLT